MKKGLGKGLGALFAEYDNFFENEEEISLVTVESTTPVDYKPTSSTPPEQLAPKKAAAEENTKAEKPAMQEKAAPIAPKEERAAFVATSETYPAQTAATVGQEPIAPAAPQEGGEFAREIALYKIIPNVNQPRKTFDAEKLRELTQSIKTHGVISPIIVVRKGESYMIIAGERRYRAAREAGLISIPAIVKNYSSQEIKEISLIENLQREDLNPIEAAVAIKQLMEEHNFTQEAVADRIGKSRPAIANTLRLLTLSPEVIQMVSCGKLSSGHARCLVVVNDKATQIKFAECACDNKMTVRDLEKAVQEYLNPKPVKPAAPQSIELKELVCNMQRAFATKVSALGNDRRGRIYIDYYSRDDLDRIVELLENVKKVAPKEDADEN